MPLTCINALCHAIFPHILREMPRCESLPGQGGRRPAALPSAVSRTCSNAHDHDSPQAASRARSGVALRPGRPGLGVSAGCRLCKGARCWHGAGHRVGREADRIGRSKRPGLRRCFVSWLPCLPGGWGVASRLGRCARLSACRRDLRFLWLLWTSVAPGAQRSRGGIWQQLPFIGSRS